MMSNEDFLSDFGKATAYLSNYLAKIQAIEKGGSNRIVSAAFSANRTYSDDEWKALSPAEKRLIASKRKAAKAAARKKKLLGTSGSASTKTAVIGPTTFKGLKRKNAKLT
jgi:hypothetical protein